MVVGLLLCVVDSLACILWAWDHDWSRLLWTRRGGDMARLMDVSISEWISDIVACSIGGSTGSPQAIESVKSHIRTSR